MIRSQIYSLLACMAFALLSMCLVACALCPLPAFAAPSQGTAAGAAELDIGSLSDRYDSLNKLENTLNEEQNVVIDTHIAVLVSVNRALDGSDVRFSGEVVGDVVNADEGYKWVNLMGTANNVIGVRLTDVQAARIQNVGGYHKSGTVLQVTGAYHVACPEHQGELEVHALSVEVLDNGGPATHMISTRWLVISVLLCVLSIMLLLIFILLRRRMERREDS